jgi:inosine-uridine nucleoside N-ribohydrolase
MAPDLFAWTRRWSIMGLLVGLASFWTGAVWADGNGHRHARSSCLIVDTDVATDDYRAFAVLFPNRDLRAVVVTEGISSVRNGSMAIALFLASGQSFAPVIPGLTAAAPPVYDWLPDARKAAERLNNLLAAPAPFAGDPNQLKLSLLDALKGCQRVEVVVLGPWTSFVEYGPMLRPFIHRVVASGRPPSENNADNFNCLYDQPACDKAAELLTKVRHAVWVDLPLGSLSYAPTKEMVAQLTDTGMPAFLRAVLNADISTWFGSTRLWDDTAALYVLEPERFKLVGKHFEPAIDEDTLRAELVKAINTPPED